MIDLRNLSLWIKDRQILQDITLTLPRGQIHGLVGESGSGKSMTALAIMGLLPEGARTTGQAMLNGRNLLTANEPTLCDLRGREIGMIFQEPMSALNPLQRIGDQVAETLRIHRAAARAQAHTIARDRLARVGLKVSPDRYPHQLSGGQRQRVCIAMAVALRPQLLIADEPTTALDVTTQARILELLRDLAREEDMGLLLITHDLAVLSQMADQVAVMKAGQIVEHGPIQHVFRQRRHAYTQALFAASDHTPTEQAAPAPEPMLTLRNVVRAYHSPRRAFWHKPPPVRALDGVSFELRRGESLGLVGESGCGKSTLARAILGLEPLQGGEIQLDGQSVRADQPMPPAMRRKMQVVFQDPYASFNPRHRVARLVAEPFHLGGIPDDADTQVARALHAVGLSPADGQKYIHAFSGGQRQRIAIARALITRPDLIILDEAVSALDVRVRARILDLLADLRRDHGLSYLFISHDLNVVRAITDRVLVMRKGQIVEHGPTAQVLQAPTHPYTQSLLDAAPRIPAALHHQEDHHARSLD